MANLTYNSIIHHNIIEKSGTTMIQILNLLAVQPISLIGKKTFLNKNVNEKVIIFNEAILNILWNFILHETVLCDNRDPLWFNSKIKSLIHEKNITFKGLRNDRRNNCLRMQLNCLKDCLNDSSEASKQKAYCRMTNKLSNAEKSSKAYWSKASWKMEKYTLFLRYFMKTVL